MGLGLDWNSGMIEIDGIRRIVGIRKISKYRYLENSPGQSFIKFVNFFINNY
jgi:hypothetical protein